MSTEALAALAAAAGTALAAAAGTALVGAMATDAWQSARISVARLFARGGTQRQVATEATLDNDAVLVERAADPEQARRDSRRHGMRSWLGRWRSIQTPKPTCRI